MENSEEYRQDLSNINLDSSRKKGFLNVMTKERLCHMIGQMLFKYWVGTQMMSEKKVSRFQLPDDVQAIRGHT